jgi:hypothetical protein
LNTALISVPDESIDVEVIACEIRRRVEEFDKVLSAQHVSRDRTIRGVNRQLGKSRWSRIGKLTDLSSRPCKFGFGVGSG